MKTSALLCQALLAASASAGVITRSDLSPGAVTISFNDLANATPVTTQYQPIGAAFLSQLGAPRTDSTNASFYGPLANGNILRSNGSSITLRCVLPGGSPAATSAMGADIIFRDTGQTTTLRVYDLNDMLLGSAITPPDTGPGDEVFLGFAAPNIAYGVFEFDPADTYVGIDNASFEPIPAPGIGVVLLGSLAVAPRRRWA